MYRYELSSLHGHSKVNPWCTGADLAVLTELSELSELSDLSDLSELK